jgi:GNAT superfamily N-acetyltransferase
MHSANVRPAVPADCEFLFALITALASYEKLSDQVTGSVAQLREHLFGARPCAEALVATLDDEPVGYALFFTTYSTFLTRPGIWLEDLFVLPERRGVGLGKALLGRLARLAVERDCGRLEWSVLDWNEPSIAFYRSLGAGAVEGWTNYRLTGQPLAELAGTRGVTRL